MFERGWTRRAARRAADAGARRGDARRPRPGGSLGPVPPGARRGDARARRGLRRARRLPARLLPASWWRRSRRRSSRPSTCNGQAVTTSPPGQIVVVNGPVRERARPPGRHGRARPRLAREPHDRPCAAAASSTLTGGGAPGGLDRSTLGHMGKVATCIAEDEEGSPWEPLSRRARLRAGRLGGDAGRRRTRRSRSRTTARARPRQLAALLGWAGAATLEPELVAAATPRSLFVVCPEHAALFAEAGWSKARVRDGDLRRAAAPGARAARLRRDAARGARRRARRADRASGRAPRTC